MEIDLLNIRKAPGCIGITPKITGELPKKSVQLMVYTVHIYNAIIILTRTVKDF